MGRGQDLVQDQDLVQGRDLDLVQVQELGP